MWELISLFRRVSGQPNVSQTGPAQNKEPEYFVQLLKYLREQKKEQSKALKAALTALADAE